MFDSHEIIIDTSELIVVQLTSLCPLWAAKKMRKALVTLRETFLSSKEHKNDRRSYLKTERTTGLDKGTMINVKPQIVSNHRKIGLEWTLISHRVHPPIPMTDQ